MVKVDLTHMFEAPTCCDGSGWYLKQVPFGHPDFGKLQRCECGRAGDPAARMSALTKALRAYGECSFENWNAQREVENTSWGGVSYNITDQQKALRIATKRAMDYVEEPEGHLFIFGAFGAGKTHLAAAIGKALAEKNMRVEYQNLPRLFDELRAAAGDFAVDERMKPLLNSDVLILDDLGAEDATSQFIQGRLFRLVDERMHLPTIFTSNLDLPVLEQKIGGRLQSRLYMAKHIWLPVSDYRKSLGGA